MSEIPHARSYEQQSAEDIRTGMTQEDRGHIDQLMLEQLLLEAEDHNLCDMGNDREMVDLRRRLRDENGNAARYILERLNSGEISSNSSRWYQYVTWLDLCASAQEASAIGTLLMRDDVILNQDRSAKSAIIRILERVGTSENIEHLSHFSSRCFDIPYQGRTPERQIDLQTGDSMEAIGALSLIGERTEDQDARQKIQDTLRLLTESIAHRTGVSVDALESSYSFMNEYARERINQFDRYFEIEDQRTEETRDPHDYGSDERDMSWEDKQDDEMKDCYHENKFVQTESRLEVIKRLRHKIKKEQETSEEPEDDNARFLRRHWLEYREDHPSPYTPTLGIEIEIRESSVLPKQAKQWSEIDKKEFLREKKKPYRKTEELGVPAGKHTFWEFANAPTHYYATLSREVQTLIEMGLINPNYPRHALHITIGGVTLGVGMEELYGEGFKTNNEEAADNLMPQSGKETFVLARSLEATGYATTGGRLLRPYLAKGALTAWAVKGVGGVKEREPEQIKLGVKKAVEFRTFQMQSLAGLDRLLRSAFLLGTALRAYQADAQGVSLGADEDPDIRRKLSGIWEKFSEESRRIFLEYNLADPKTAWRAPDYIDNDQRRAENPFKHFGDMIDDARQHPQSKGAEFVAKMRGLIISTRKQVADIVYKHTS